MLAALALIAAMMVTQVPVGIAGVSAAQSVPLMGPLNVARQAGVYSFSRTWSVNVADVNGDGYDDAFVPEHDPESYGRGESIPAPHMYMGSVTGQFADLGWPGNATDRHDCAWGDVNRDGRLDLFCAVGLTAGSVNEMWMQQPDGSFVNRAQAMGLTGNSHGRYRTSTFVDANNDGWPDIFVSRYTGSNGDPQNPAPPEANPYPNLLWLNHGGTSFSLNTSMGLTTPKSAGRFNNQCNQAVDFNHDGLQDLLFCSQGGVHLYKNTGDRFVDVAGSLGIGGNYNDAEMTDLTGDGIPDLVEVSDTVVRIFKQQPGGAFTQIYSTAVTHGLNVAVGDFDGNGFKDVYVVGSCTATGSGPFPPDAPDRILFNSGNGFSTTTIPAITSKEGCGDDVGAIDYNHDGLTDFLVTNGRRQERGPTQLWTYAAVQQLPDITPPDVTPPNPNIGFNGIVGAGVPVNVKWLGTDDSGVQSFHFYKSTDGGQTFQNLYTGPALDRTVVLTPGHQAEFGLSATDRAGNTSTMSRSSNVTAAVRQENDAGFNYAGNWNDDGSGGAWGGGVKWSSSAGSTMTFNTPAGARWVGLVGTRGPGMGRATVFFDGSSLGNLNLYSPTTKNRRIIWERGLTPGVHTIKLVVSGVSDPASSGNRVDVDGAAMFNLTG
jgi:hypothetical protein